MDQENLVNNAAPEPATVHVDEGQWNAEEVFGDRAEYENFLNEHPGQVLQQQQQQPKPKLEFQSIPHQGGSVFAQGASANAADNVSGFSEEPDNEAPVEIAPAMSADHWWQIGYYAHLFDVDSRQVLNRMRKSFFPIGKTFWETVNPNPDLYGPFWITATMVFLTAVAGNFGAYLESTKTGASFQYRFEIVGVAASVMFAYTFLLSVAVWGVFKWWGVGLSFKEIVCLYGYSLTPYLPVAMLCVIPFSVAQWVSVAAGFIFSTGFVLLNIFRALVENHLKKGLPTLLVLLAFNAALALGLKLYFWDFTNSAWTNGGL